ncbi:formimidoylglutamase [Aquimarina pacifica]|uniref:formimidoylglutamase n=1 Tax=Aquimarina pacifica TaxID=1296415 RepID=UPI0004BAA080|nr:formimidoylglutamase [Aquimarina pacifica]
MRSQINNYRASNPTIWKGRESNDNLYFHEIVECIDLQKKILPKTKVPSFAILGYAIDEGVRRNLGRIGAAEGPDAIRNRLAPLSNHMADQTQIWDVGNIYCQNKDLEESQLSISEVISKILENDTMPIVLGGGHDLAYPHFNGIKKQFPKKTIGIINMDAHFDLRKVEDKGNSGTPFFQILTENNFCNYLCLGIQKSSNNRNLYATAVKLDVEYLENSTFTIQNQETIYSVLEDFIKQVDIIYCTIDLDGFSSMYAPGVSAPSPVGFSPDIALKTLELICMSKKLISVDIVELNPKYDIDNCTARLAAQLALYIIENIQIP